MYKLCCQIPSYIPGAAFLFWKKVVASDSACLLLMYVQLEVPK